MARNQLEGFPFHTSMMDITKSKVLRNGVLIDLDTALEDGGGGAGSGNISLYGGVADGVTDVRTAVTAALADGVKTIVFDAGASSYYWGSALSIPDGVSLVAGDGRPTFTFNASSGTSRFFTMPARTRSGIRGIRMDGTAVLPRDDAFIVINGGSVECFVDDCVFDDCPGGGTGCVVISGSTSKHNRVTGNRFDSTYSVPIGISAASYNTIAFNVITATLNSFSIRIGELASSNTIAHNRIVDSAAEAIGIYYNCDYNQVIGNHCEDCGDNGISISGRWTVCSGNTCIANTKAGIGVWGEFNSITGNVLKNNGLENDCPLWADGQTIVLNDERIHSGGRYRCTNAGGTAATGSEPVHAVGATVTGADGIAWLGIQAIVRWSGVWVSVGYSGTGQFNVISGNNSDDDQTEMTQYYGVRIEGAGGYTAWANGQSITSGLYRVYGLNIYISTNSGTTATGSEPVHTSGTATGADGVTWEWRKAFISSSAPRGNEVTGNIGRRTKSSVASSDAGNWAINTLRENGASFQNAVNGYRVITLPSYASNALALAGGLIAGDFYRNGDVVQVVH